MSMTDEPIIQSLLDTDKYKLTMGQGIFLRHGSVQAKSRYTNRTKSVNIANSVNEAALREQLDHAKTLRFTEKDIEFLRSQKTGFCTVFHDEYLDFLSKLRLPPYELSKHEGNYSLEFEGLWREQTYWEIPALAIVAELHHRSLMSELSKAEKNEVYRNGIYLNREKLDFLSRMGIRFSDFGSRRRASRLWHERVFLDSLEQHPEIITGTSNLFLARETNVPAIGTIAHEWFMGLSGIGNGTDEEILRSHNKALDQWWSLYGHPFSIALTDTYGTDFFFRDFTQQQAKNWKGLRHDSGSPIEFGKKAIAFYKSFGIDPREKTLVFADSLDIDKMAEIFAHFSSTTNINFGWGTNFSNDLADYPPISQVIKLVEANGKFLVKLSDNLAKAIGPTKEIERFKKIFGHTTDTYEECRY